MQDGHPVDQIQTAAETPPHQRRGLQCPQVEQTLGKRNHRRGAGCTPNQDFAFRSHGPMH
jgi:hypothetical protein